MKYIIIISFILGVAFAPSVMTAWNDATKLIDAENECIAMYIANGVERSNIDTYKGMCYMKNSNFSL